MSCNNSLCIFFNTYPLPNMLFTKKFIPFCGFYFFTPFLSLSVKKPFGVLIVIASRLWINLGSIISLTIALTLLIHEQEIPFHLFSSSSPWTVAHQTPPPMEFSRQEYWSGFPFSSPGDLPDPGIGPGDRTRVSRIVGRCFTVWATRESYLVLL